MKAEEFDAIVEQAMREMAADVHLEETFHPIEADPTGRNPHEPGAKLDAGKVYASLLADFSLALTEVAKVATFGVTQSCPPQSSRAMCITCGRFEQAWMRPA